MRYIVDIDGVLADFDGTWRRWHRADCANPEPICVTIPDQYGVLFGADHRTESFWPWFKNRGGFARVDPMADAAEVMFELGDMGHETIVVTARPPEARRETERWLRHHRIRTTSLVFEERKHAAPWLGMLRADAIVDDHPDVLRSWVHNRRQGRHHHTQVVAFDWPWNHTEPADARVGSMMELASHWL